MQKIEKEFMLTDSSVNCYGMRFLTSGYMLNEFQRNPIGYFMHDRASGILVSWSDFRIENNDKVYAKPSINLSHPRGQRTVHEINNGFLNGASVGHVIVLEMDEEPALTLPFQTGANLTKWYNKECSLVDIPGNDNALKLFNKDGVELNLSAFQNSAVTKNTDISLIDDSYKAELAELLKFSGSELYYNGKLERLKELSFSHFKVKYKEAFGVEYTGPAASSLISQADVGNLGKVITDTELKDLLKLSGNELYHKEKLERLKELSFPHFKVKYKEAFGIEYWG